MSATPDTSPAFTPEPEDQARADLYALLAHLFYGRATQGLFDALAQADAMSADKGSALAAAWADVQAACGVVDAQTAQQEYDDVFVGVGRAVLSIYASHYMSGQWKEEALADLRGELARLGLSRNTGTVEPEDHLAALLEVMRHLIVGAEHGADAALQEKFFEQYLSRWYGRFCDAVLEEPKSNFYRPVTRLLRSFLDIELESLQAR